MKHIDTRIILTGVATLPDGSKVVLRLVQCSTCPVRSEAIANAVCVDLPEQAEDTLADSYTGAATVVVADTLF